jgi:hypothetical protein
MHTISGLRKTLGLSTTNQVRNRIEAIRDVLSDHLRRGPNNQILITDAGVDCLRELQELYDSGLTMAQASDVVRAKSREKTSSEKHDSSRFVAYGAKPTEPAAFIAALQEEIAFLRARVSYLEERLPAPHAGARADRPTTTWWDALREDVDAP